MPTSNAMGSFLLIDNYDSFTFNLQHLLAAELGELPIVCRNDEIPFDALRRGEFRALVISPGPGRPEEADDFGGCREAILEFDLPILGVCLGHQGIATAFGGGIEPAPAPVHGEATAILHEGAPMFAGVPESFDAVRYHSWVVAEPLPDCLEVTARSEDGAVMGLVHRERPIWGVQFHPESIGTEVGAAIVRNFVVAAGGAVELSSRIARGKLHRGPVPPTRDAPPTWDVVVRELGAFPDPEQAFAEAFGAEREAFWLDDATGSGRSFIGASVGPGAEVLTQGPAEDSIFDLLRDRLRERKVGADLPFDLPGGYVGFFGYGLKRILGSPNRVEAETPDARFIAATRTVAFDHRSRRAFAVGLVPPGVSADAIAAEVEDLCRRLERVPESRTSGPTVDVGSVDAGSVDLALDRPAYLAAVATAQRELVAGESYELCLTNRLAVEVGEVDPFEVFTRLRRLNPAPFGAFLRFGDLAVLSTSPERFLRIGGGRVEARPVKGTRPRGTGPTEDERLREELRGSVKDRAENLMIVDLLRNDLSRVCEVGSVEVEEIFGLETHPHVHQLVSTIRGRLRGDRDTLACVEACFPGGSMTGAPKLRSMQILDRLEPEPRGVYSGALGYLGLGGEIDLSIVIRAAVLRDGVATIGSGGAVTVRSTPAEEWEEMLVKARPTLSVLGDFARR